MVTLKTNLFKIRVRRTIWPTRRVSTMNLTSSIDLAIVANFYTIFCTWRLFQTALDIRLAISPFSLWVESSCFVISRNCLYVYGSPFAIKDLDCNDADIFIILLFFEILKSSHSRTITWKVKLPKKLFQKPLFSFIYSFIRLIILYR